MNEVLLQVDANVATLTFNQPERLNTISIPFITTLQNKLNEIKANKAIQIVVMRAEGRHYSAGGDLHMIGSLKTHEDYLHMMGLLKTFMLDYHDLDAISLCQFNGTASGLGASFVLMNDLIVAEPQSRLIFNFAGMALNADGALNYFLKERFGSVLTKKLLMSNAVLDADTLLKKGVVESVNEDLNAAVADLVAQLQHTPLQAHRHSKRIQHALCRAELEATLDLETEYQWQSINTADHKEGIRAFFAKEAPVFKGQ